MTLDEIAKVAKPMQKFKRLTSENVYIFNSNNILKELFVKAEKEIEIETYVHRYDFELAYEFID